MLVRPTLMIYELYNLRDLWFEPDSRLHAAFNVFRYTTFRAGGAFFTAFLLALLLGPRIIRRLISLKVGQPIRTAAEVHKLAELHGGKAGTPTMGGVLILLAFVVSCVAWVRPGNPFLWVILFVALALGALGFADDFQKVVRKNSAGLSARLKLAGQLLVALLAGGALLIHPDTRDFMRELWLPFVKEPLVSDMGLWTLALFALVIVGASNAVNLTDGLDGLATGCMLTSVMAYALFGYVTGNVVYATFLGSPYHPAAGEIAVLCLALAGALLGFLWYNCHPARVFMGDTGSLALGGTLGVIALCCRQELVLIIVGGVFVMEAMSVILQVGSFKLRGKRIFRMAPIHHHFELKGWKESQVIVRFWMLSLLFAVLALGTLKLR